MTSGCLCQQFSDEYPAPVFGSFEVALASEGKAAKVMYECEGRVISFRNTNSQGEQLKTMNGSLFVEIVVYGLDTDVSHDPRAHFLCYHKHLFECLALTIGEQVHFYYNKTITQATEAVGKPGTKGFKPAKPLVVWQNIEDVTRIGLTMFKDGKPAAQEQAQPEAVKAEEESQVEPVKAEDESQEAAPNPDQLATLCKRYKLDPDAVYNGALRYEIGSEREIFDRETGEIITGHRRKRSEERG